MLDLLGLPWTRHGTVHQGCVMSITTRIWSRSTLAVKLSNPGWHHRLQSSCRGGGRRKAALSQITLEQLEQDGLFDLPIQVQACTAQGLTHVAWQCSVRSVHSVQSRVAEEGMDCLA